MKNKKAPDGSWLWAEVGKGCWGKGSQAPGLTFIQKYEEFQQKIGGVIPAVQKEQDFQGGRGQPFT